MFHLLDSEDNSVHINLIPLTKNESWMPDKALKNGIQATIDNYRDANISRTLRPDTGAQTLVQNHKSHPGGGRSIVKDQIPQGKNGNT